MNFHPSYLYFVTFPEKVRSARIILCKSDTMTMKVKWKEHETILAILLALLALLSYCWELGGLHQEEIEKTYMAPFVANNTSFHFFGNIFLPGIGMILLFFGAYYGINAWLVPSLKKINPASLLRGVLIFFGISFILALGANVATYVARPYYYSYNRFNVLSIFGYNDRPLSNIFAGFDTALGMAGVVLLYALLRDLLIRKIEQYGKERSHLMLITNGITTFLVVYLAVLVFLADFRIVALEGPFAAFYGFLPGVLLFVLTNLYIVFPRLEGHSFWATDSWKRLLYNSFLCTLPFIFFLGRYFQEFWPVLFISWAIQLFVVTPLSWLLYQQQKDRILGWIMAERGLVKSKADLQLLRSQLNPHFLFNALNTLYGSALMNGARPTAEGIQKLGDMMRFMLHDNQQDFISMHTEIEYLKNYISLQKLRIESSEDMYIHDDINELHCNHKIAPMLLIPFVENAFKHGFHISRPSWVDIKLECDDKNIFFQVRNSVHPEEEGNPERERSGIGLENVRKRLELLYDKRYQLRYGAKEKEFVVSLNIRFDYPQ
jgi:two-component system LytT family sensor kinase